MVEIVLDLLYIYIPWELRGIDGAWMLGIS